MFKSVTIDWGGKDYVIPADSQMRLIAEVEAALQGDGTRNPLYILTQGDGPTHMETARAYGAALQFAGAKVSVEDVYFSIQEDVATGSAARGAEVQAKVIALISILSPPLGAKIVGKSEGKKSKGSVSD